MVYLHTTKLVSSYHRISLGIGQNKIKIAHISDLHTQGVNRLEQQLVDAIDKEKPDLILITGDIATPSGTESGYRDVLTKFKAPLGVYFVQGNWEYWEHISNLENILKDAGIVNLTNRAIKVKDRLWLVGFDDSEEGVPNLDVTSDIPADAQKIGMFHSPLFFGKIAGKIDLAFAGHSHGGQVRLPFWGPVWLPRGTGHYDQGWFKDKKSDLFVSRGIGTSILPIRINCPPEVAFTEILF